MTLIWRDLFLQTLREPETAAEQILAFPVSRGTIYMALIAGAALNSVVTGVSLQLFPLPPQWPAFISHPFSYFVIAAAGLLLFVQLLAWSGRVFGGQGQIDDLLKLMIWMQFVRVGLQAIGLVLTVLLPILGGLYSIAMLALTLWIVLHFIKAGHRLSSLGAAALVLFVTIVGLIIGLSLLLALTGLGSMGVTPNV